MPRTPVPHTRRAARAGAPRRRRRRRRARSRRRRSWPWRRRRGRARHSRPSHGAPHVSSCEWPCPHGRGSGSWPYAQRSLKDSASHEVLIETRWEAGPAVGVAILLQVALAVSSETQGWTTWVIPSWVWLFPVVPELFFIVSTLPRPHRALVEMGIRRKVGIVLVALASAGNSFLVLAVIASLVSGHETSGAHLLLKGASVWLTNVILFGLWFWLFHRGGPASRLEPDQI